MEKSAIWREIERALRAEIEQGRYNPGDKLPTEAALATRFAVNRHTVRRALAALAADGLIHARRGAGVFVAAKPTTYPLGRRVRFHQNLIAGGQTPAKEILRLETAAAAAREAEALGLREGAPVHIWEGVAFADGAPVTLFHSWFCATRFPDLKNDLAETKSVTEALRRAGVEDYTRASTRLNAEPAGAMHALRLRLSKGAPLL
ncbi:MAG: phosphonate metabolism transcriptional regulator PhnF, partial [Pseudomonadota bacterium]